jgi:DNA-binding transcriptional regulator YiaG
MALRDGLRDEHVIAMEAERRAVEDRLRAEHGLEMAKARLEALRLAGPSKILADTAPLPGELAEGEDAPERESWEAVIARTATRVRRDVDLSAPTEDPGAVMRMRRHLNFEEFGFVYGTTAHTVRRWLNGRRRPPAGLYGELAAVTVTLSERRRVIDVNRLPQHWWNGLCADQRLTVDRLLMIPMGRSQVFGPKLTEETISRASAVAG